MEGRQFLIEKLKCGTNQPPYILAYKKTALDAVFRKNIFSS